jgi:hypothetical protein
MHRVLIRLPGPVDNGVFGNPRDLNLPKTKVIITAPFTMPGDGTVFGWVSAKAIFAVVDADTMYDNRIEEHKPAVSQDADIAALLKDMKMMSTNMDDDTEDDDDDASAVPMQQEPRRSSRAASHRGHASRRNNVTNVTVPMQKQVSYRASRHNKVDDDDDDDDNSSTVPMQQDPPPPPLPRRHGASRNEQEEQDAELVGHYKKTMAMTQLHIQQKHLEIAKKEVDAERVHLQELTVAEEARQKQVLAFKIQQLEQAERSRLQELAAAEESRQKQVLDFKIQQLEQADRDRQEEAVRHKEKTTRLQKKKQEELDFKIQQLEQADRDRQEEAARHKEKAARQVAAATLQAEKLRQLADAEARLVAATVVPVQQQPTTRAAKKVPTATQAAAMQIKQPPRPAAQLKQPEPDQTPPATPVAQNSPRAQRHVLSDDDDDFYSIQEGEDNSDDGASASNSTSSVDNASTARAMAKRTLGKANLKEVNRSAEKTRQHIRRVTRSTHMSIDAGNVAYISKGLGSPKRGATVILMEDS